MVAVVPLVFRQYLLSTSTPRVPPLVLEIDMTKPIKIGRFRTNDMVLFHGGNRDGKTDLKISRFHAEVHSDGLDFYLVHMSDNSPTYLNGVSMERNVRTKIAAGDLVTFVFNKVFANGAYNPYMFKLCTVASLEVKVPKNTVGLKRKHCKELEEDFKCGICFDTLLNPFSLVCGHTTCGDCLATWFGSRGTETKSCPTCRHGVSYQPMPCKALNDVVERIMTPHMSEKELADRRDRLEIWNNRRDYRESLEGQLETLDTHNMVVLDM